MPQTTNGETTPLLPGSELDRERSHGGWPSDNPSPWVAYPKHFAHVSWLVLTSNYVNVLLVFVPLGIISGALGWNPTAVFCLNFFAIVPLASLLSFATEELSAKLGETIGGLMNASFGNAVELIVSERRQCG
jgi:Ca2+:H+ antiporter